ncbi:MAG: hypothetical protein PHX27_00640, partial [Candidatus ainarchaeum sp.]|nr:hypothetical protein [Candidatus ainarchaeum sp.]
AWSGSGHKGDIQITNSYSKGSMPNNSYNGGFGGAVNANNLISNSYALVNYPGHCAFGSTYSNPAAAVNSFYDSDICSSGSGGTGFTGKSTELMTTESTFTDAGWDFENVWGINPSINNGYPHLLWEEN